MQTPSPPPPPDPYATSAAQQQANIGTAVAQTAMGNANQVTPTGSITYNQTGQQTVLDAQGNPISVPTYTVTQQLAPAQQQMLNLQNQTGISMDQTALQQAQQIGGILGSPLTASSMAPVQTGVAGGPTLGTINQAPTFQVPGLQTQNQQYSPYTTGYNTSQVNPTLNTSGVGNITQTFDNTGLTNTNAIQGGLGNTDFTQNALDAQNAIMSRLSPELQRQRDALDNQLVNSGLQRGSPEYEREMDAFNRSANDQQMQAVLQGYNVANQLFGQRLQSGQFANAAQSQAYNEALGRGAFANSAEAQQFSQAMNTGNYALAATQANNAAAQAQAQFKNTAQSQQFAQDQAQIAFNNTVTTQGAEAANAAAQQAYQNAMSNVQQQNAAAQQQYNNALAAIQAANQAQAQQYQQTVGLYTLPINAITGLMSGGQVTQPQGAPYSAGVIQPTNVAGNVYNSAALAEQNYQQQLANQNAMMGGLFGLGATGLMAAAMPGAAAGATPSLLSRLFGTSDRRLKQNIIDTGLKLLNGLSIYSYRYIGDTIDRIGVMADEVKKIKPQAVVRFADGYDRVDYSQALT